MKIDCGFFDKNGEYKEDIQEVEMLSVKELNEIELIKAQNEGLKKQNKELQEEIKKYAAINEQETKDYAELKAENKRLLKQKNNVMRKNIVLYTTLQEIKEIAETAINGGYVTKSSDYSEGMEIIGHYVMQKITKAEEK